MNSDLIEAIGAAYQFTKELSIRTARGVTAVIGWVAQWRIKLGARAFPPADAPFGASVFRASHSCGRGARGPSEGAS